MGLAQYCDDSRARSDARDGKNDSICMKEQVPPYETAYRKKQEEIQGQMKKTEEQNAPQGG